VVNIRAIATMHRREMNRAESKYAEYLRERLMVGEIRWWAFECWKFRLADDTYYTPDFIVVDNALRIEAHEVKAEWSTGKPGWQEDARIKIKVAAEQYPIRFVAMTLMKDHSWHVEEFIRGREEPPPPTDLELLGEALGMAMVPRDVSDVVRAIRQLREVPRV
jgi:hypothetical protein